MGTYLIKPTLVSSKSGAWTRLSNGATSNPELVLGENGTGIYVNNSAPLVALIRFSGEYFLDGAGVPTLFQNLPTGFKLTSAAVQSNNGAFDVGCSAVMEFDVNTVSPSFNTAGIHTYAWPGLILSPYIYLNGVGFQFTRAGGGGAGQEVHNLLSVTGNYSIEAFTWTLATPSPVSVGDQVTITSNPSDPNHLKLDQLTPTVEVLDSGGVVRNVAVEIVTQTEFLLVFIILALPQLSDATMNILATGNGVQFSGSISLGTLEILIANGSGMYTLVNNKTNDTLYTGISNNTADVKIPNPFFKTGFIGG